MVPSTLGRFPCRPRGSCLGCQQGLGPNLDHVALSRVHKWNNERAGGAQRLGKAGRGARQVNQGPTHLPLHPPRTPGGCPSWLPPTQLCEGGWQAHHRGRGLPGCPPVIIQAGLAALGQGRPPPTDLDGGREGHHHGPMRQNPRNQGLRTAHFSGDVLSVHCCHTLFVKPRAQPRHTHSTWGKHRVSQGPSGPAQPPPRPGPRSSGLGRPCPCPRS